MEKSNKCIYLVKDDKRVKKEKPSVAEPTNETVEQVVKRRGRPKKIVEEQVITVEKKRRGRPKKNN